MSDDTPLSPADQRRLDRVERNHEALAREVSSLSGTVALIAQNLKHQGEMTEVHFKMMDEGLKSVQADLKSFMNGINDLITGRTVLPQQQALMQDWRDWRDKTVDPEIELVRAERNKRSGMFAAVGSARLAFATVAAVVVSVGSLVVAILK